MSVVKHPEQRVAVFIDTQNLYHSAKNLYKSKVNFGNVLKIAVGGRKLVRALSYVVNTESGEELPFFEALEKIGIEIKTKDLQIFYGGAKKADWDVGLAVDAIKHASKVDAIVLATGDGDFVPLVEYLKSQGCQVEGITFGRSASSRFRDTVDDFIDMDDNPSEFVIGYRPSRNNATRRRSSPVRKQQSSSKRGPQKAASKVVGTDTDHMN